MSMRIGSVGAGVIESDDGKGCTGAPTIHGSSLPEVRDGVEFARASNPVYPADDGGGCTGSGGFPPKSPPPKKGGPILE
jgi:hypothetical protein